MIVVHARSHAGGVVLIEVLVTATIVAIGILGLARFQGRTAVAEIEAQQRTQALLLARDMADRLVANRPGAGSYVGDYGGAAGSCDASSAAARDRCAWNAALGGVDERLGSTSAGGLRNGRGCVRQAGERRYRIVVAWQGTLPTSAPLSDCGRGAYGPDAYRRAVVLPVELPDLRAS